MCGMVLLKLTGQKIRSPMDANPELGTCCVCERTERVRTILQLHKISPTPGKGWGCFQCGIPMDGAIAVVCDRCFDAHGQKIGDALKFACKGYPAIDGRVPIGELQGEHEHLLSLHPELEDVGFPQ